MFGGYLGLLGIFQLSPAQDLWIRVGGMLTFLLGVYYIPAARTEMTDVLQWTVLRAAVLAFLITFVLLDFLGATWTGWTLRSV